MILHQNGLVKLEYTPATDILFVKWPDIQHFVMPELKLTLQILVENIRNYDIKNLLINSQSTTLEVDPLEYKEALRQFAEDLQKTRLNKMARIVTTDEFRERPIKELVEQDRISLSFQLKHFADHETALEWLKSNN